MTTLVDIDRLINNERQFTVQQKNTLLKCFAAAFGIDSGLISDVTSPNDTIDVAISQGDAAIDINGNPPGDDSNSLGDRTHRWQGVVMPSDGEVSFHTGNVGPGQASVLHWTDNVGPVFSDAHADVDLTFNVQSLAANRTATWQNSSGTVAWLTDVQNAFNLVTADATLTPLANGNTINIATPSYIINNYVFVLAGSISGATIHLANGAFDGQIINLSFNNVVTTLSITGNANSTGLTLPTTTAVNSSFTFQWDTADWIRVR